MSEGGVREMAVARRDCRGENCPGGGVSLRGARLHDWTGLPVAQLRAHFGSVGSGTLRSRSQPSFSSRMDCMATSLALASSAGKA